MTHTGPAQLFAGVCPLTETGPLQGDACTNVKFEESSKSDRSRAAATEVVFRGCVPGTRQCLGLVPACQTNPSLGRGLGYGPDNDGLHRCHFQMNGLGRWSWVQRSSDGKWCRFGDYERDLAWSRGLSIKRHKWIYKAWGKAVAIFEWGPRVEVPVTVGAGHVDERDPIFSSLWATFEECVLACGGKPGNLRKRATARPLSANEAAREARLLKSAKADQACVYLSLYHLATRATTHDWLMEQEWGPASTEQILELCRGWTAREQRSLGVCYVRRKNSNSTAASSELAHMFVPLGQDGAGRATLYICKTSPDGVEPKGHALPSDASDMTSEFAWPAAAGFVGRKLGYTAHVVEPLSRKKGKGREQEVPDEPAPAPRPSPRPVRSPTVDEMSLSALDEALSVSRPQAQASGTAVCTECHRAFDKSTSPSPCGVCADCCKERACAGCGKDVDREDDDAKPTAYCADCKKARKRANLPKPEPFATAPRQPQVPAVALPMSQPSSKKDETGLQSQTVELADVSEQSLEPVPYVVRWDYEGGVSPMPSYDGPVQQTGFELHWRSGWWSLPDGRGFGCTDWASALVSPPALACATMDCVRSWGTRTVYIPPKAWPGYCFLREGVFTDGRNKCQSFAAGSLIKLRWNLYEACPVTVEYCGRSTTGLELRKVSSGSLRSALPSGYLSGSASLVSFQPRTTLGGKEHVLMKWHGAAKSEKSILASGMINIIRSQQLDKLKPADPDQIVPAIQELAKCYEEPLDVSGPYLWGYCYAGCGRERPGKFKGRVCPECSKQNSTLGSWYANGSEIANSLNPVRYPGVVHTLKRHPPLKASAATRGVYGQDYMFTRKAGGKDELVPWEEVLAFLPKPSAGPTLGGVGIDGAIAFATQPGPRPLAEAVGYRVFKDLGPDRIVNAAAFVRAGHLVESLLPTFSQMEVPYDERGRLALVVMWINSMRNSRRRNALLRCFMDLKRNCWVRPLDWELIKPFVKSENLPHFSAAKQWGWGGAIQAGTTYVARLIQAPSDYSHIVAGPILKPMVRGLKDDWSCDNWIFYASVAPEKLDKWLERIRHSRSFFWSDYTAFDATYSDEAWDLIEDIYRRVAPDAPVEFWEVLKRWRRPVGKTKLRECGWTMRYEANTCNCSGRDDTALANALLNGIVLSLSFAAALAGVAIEELQPSHIQAASVLVKIGVVGDDSLVGCDFEVDNYRGAILNNIKQFGLIAKVETSQHLHDVTFLGQMPYPVDDGTLQWGPTIGRRLYKAYWRMDEGDGGLPSWTRGVAQQMMLSRNVPILHELACRVDELLRGHSLTVQKKDPNRIWHHRSAETARWNNSTISWLTARYERVGLTREMILTDLSVISQIGRLPAVVHMEGVRRILSQDDL